jgi:hypothetical protein
MVSPTDFIHLEYSPDLTQAGAAYVCEYLISDNDRTVRFNLVGLRQLVAKMAVELAFRRYLTKQKIPHNLIKVTHFTDPGRYYVAIGGRRCEIQSTMLTRKDQIRQVRKHPETFLKAQAIMPKDLIESPFLDDEDLYIFAFINALIANSPRSIKKALAVNQPLFLIHVLPPGWAEPNPWGSLGNLVLNSDLSQEINLELGGLGAGRGIQKETVRLIPTMKTQVKTDFYSLRYLHPSGLPSGILEVQSPKLDKTHLVHPYEWSNIWIYGLEITLTGYLTRGEFRNRASNLPSTRWVFQEIRTRQGNLALPIMDLNPLQDLFKRAKSWKKDGEFY